jgi:hypothetical protein
VGGDLSRMDRPGELTAVLFYEGALCHARCSGTCERYRHERSHRVRAATRYPVQKIALALLGNMRFSGVSRNLQGDES